MAQTTKPARKRTSSETEIALIDSVVAKGRPRIVRRNGKRVAVIMSASQYDQWRADYDREYKEDGDAALAAWAEIEREMKETGKTLEEVTVSHAEVKRRLGL